MPVTQRVQAPGIWDVQLAANTPREVTDKFEVGAYGFSHLVVVPAWIDPSTVDTAGMFEASRYTGRYVTQGDRLHLSGDHCTAWLGDADGKGVVYSVDLTFTQSRALWVAQVNSAVTAWTAGVSAGGSGNLTWTWPAETCARDALDYICKHFGIEWRMRNQLFLDVAPASTLYSLPTVICTPWWDGSDSEHTGMRSTIRQTRSLERYVYAVSATDDGSIAATEVDPSPTYYDASGAPVDIRRAIRAPGVDLTGLAAFAEAEGTADFSWRDEIRVSTDHYCPLQHLTPGDYIKVWDPENQIWGLGNEAALFALGGPAETHYGGHICWPLVTRVYGITMKLRQGMGVYMVRGVDGSIIDLTDYVVWESGDSVLEVGTDPRRVSSAVKRRGVGV